VHEINVALAAEELSFATLTRITFSDRHTELSGQLQAHAGREASDYFVVFPDDRTMWRSGARRIRASRASTDATYVFRDLPPGTYRLAAATDVSSDDLIDPAFFEFLLPSTVVITLGDGERRTQSLRIGGSDVLHSALPPARGPNACTLKLPRCALIDS
jgi:uncharacterized protein (DUF2141 family)